MTASALSVITIMGGKLKRSKLHFPLIPNLRPTPGRVRETLFNWLHHGNLCLPCFLSQARCLDLFAGSGSLGFEAYSQGIAHVTMLESNPQAINCLIKNKNQLKAKSIHIIQGKFPKDIHLLEPYAPFDLVFLDPPFESPFLIKQSITWLENSHTTQHTYVYLEYNSPIETYIPSSWKLLKTKKAGQVYYGLAQKPVSLKEKKQVFAPPASSP